MDVTKPVSTSFALRVYFSGQNQNLGHAVLDSGIQILLHACKLSLGSRCIHAESTVRTTVEAFVCRYDRPSGRIRNKACHDTFADNLPKALTFVVQRQLGGWSRNQINTSPFKTCSQYLTTVGAGTGFPSMSRIFFGMHSGGAINRSRSAGFPRG